MMVAVHDPGGWPTSSDVGQSILAGGSYAPVLVLLLVVIALVAGVMALTHAIGPRRTGPVKDDTYEAGMPPIGDARQRFRVPFYLLAVMFLLFDVEMVFLWPWAVVFHDAAVSNRGLVPPCDRTYLLVTMAIFLAFLVVGYLYDWGKGVFRWT